MTDNDSKITANQQKQNATHSRPKRIDAQRKMDSVLKAAVQVFAKSGVDATVREIAKQAGVGLGTVYRHFPQRSDLIVAVYQKQVDECANAAAKLANQYEPFEALSHWMLCYTDFITTKRGLAKGLSSSDPTYSALPGYLFSHLGPALQMLLDAAVESKSIRDEFQANELLLAIAALGRADHDEQSVQLKKTVGLLVDGLRFIQH